MNEILMYKNIEDENGNVLERVEIGVRNETQQEALHQEGFKVVKESKKKADK